MARPIYELLPYRKGDEAQLSLRADMATALAAYGGCVHPGPSYSLWRDGRVIVIAGVADFDTETPTLWALGGSLEPKDWVVAAKRVRGYLAAVWAPLRRPLWLMVDEDVPDAIPFGRKLGFEVTETRGEMRWTPSP